MSNSLSIYVADLAAYNAGVLRGAWLDVDGFDKDDLQSSISELMFKWDCEEYAFHDYDGFPEMFGEYPDLDSVISYIQAVDQHDKVAVDAYLTLFDLCDLEQFGDRFVGEFDSDQDFVWQYLEDTGELNAIPEHLQIYFDAEAWLRDQVLGGAFLYASVNSKVYIFTGH